MNAAPLSLNRPKRALYLSGGGAHGAYQAGVIRAIMKITGAKTLPIDILCGTSTGAFNVAALAMSADRFAQAVHHLGYVWGNFTPQQVYRTDLLHVGKILSRFILSGLFGSNELTAPKAIFDNTPLFRLMGKHIDFTKISQNIRSRNIHALSIVAANYQSGNSVTFFQSEKDIAQWQRSNRRGEAAIITLNHLMASAAIPLVFPAVRLNNRYFGDGALRQYSPLASPINLGADRILVVSLNGKSLKLEDSCAYPQASDLGSFMLHSLFVDALDSDLERLRRINHLLDTCPNANLPWRNIDTLRLSPSRSFNSLADGYYHMMPGSVQYLLRFLGGGRESALLSYLMFLAPFTRKLMELGYQDTLDRREQIVDFFTD